MSQSDILSTITQVTGVGPKHWQPFEEKSPGGVPMTGYVCLQESDYNGSIAASRQFAADLSPRPSFLAAPPGHGFLIKAIEIASAGHCMPGDLPTEIRLRHEASRAML
jgi:hypothetical protein